MISSCDALPPVYMPYVQDLLAGCHMLNIPVCLLLCRYHGCCCQECQAAPRLLRPIKINGGNYGNWGNYADVDTLGPIMASARKRELTGA